MALMKNNITVKTNFVGQETHIATCIVERPYKTGTRFLSFIKSRINFFLSNASYRAGVKPLIQSSDSDFLFTLNVIKGRTLLKFIFYFPLCN